MTDDYSDLPDWIRPGAKLALLTGSGGYTFVTVVRITRTQIVTASDSHRTEDRFNRKPNPPSMGHPEPWYVRRGSYFDELVRRDHPQVVKLRVVRIAENAAAEVAEARKVFGNPRAASDSRPADERAMDLIDAIENAARKARRKIDRVLDPGDFLAAEHAQDLTTTTED